MGYLLKALVALSTISCALAGPCSVCPDPLDTITQPDKIVAFPGYDPTPCGTIALLVPLALDEEDVQCHVAQNISSICGCPVREDAYCSLCPNKESQTKDSLKIDYGNEFIPTCELLEAFLRSFGENSDECLDGQAFAEECGCTVIITNESTPLENSAMPSTSPILDPASLEENNIVSPSGGCNICWDGSSSQSPEVDTRWVINALAEAYEGGMFGDNDKSVNALVDALAAFEGAIGCGTTEALMHQLLDPGDQLCIDSQRFFGGICGCKPLPNGCDFCPSDVGVPLPDKEYSVVGAELDFVPTCGGFDKLISHFPASSDWCWIAQVYNYECGCNGGERVYMGSGTSIARKAALTWVPRICGILSILCSALMLWDILKDPKKRKGSMYHELIVGMSVFDIIGSFWWALATLPTPEVLTDYNDLPSEVYGARGNDATCTAQGFFLELGYMGSIGYNLALSFYYLNVIVRNKRKHYFQKMRPWFHGPVLLIASALAFAGIPYYEALVVICQVPPPMRVSEDWTLITFFSIIPVCTVILVASANMAIIYWKVRKQNGSAQKWRFGSNTHSSIPAASVSGNSSVPDTSSVTGRSSTQGSVAASISRWQRRMSTAGGLQRGEQAVVWQSICYLLAFFLTWPVYLVSNVYPTITNYTFWLLLVTFVPLQGCFNAFVYFRPRWMPKRKTPETRRRAGSVGSVELSRMRAIPESHPAPSAACNSRTNPHSCYSERNNHQDETERAHCEDESEWKEDVVPHYDTERKDGKDKTEQSHCEDKSEWKEDTHCDSEINDHKDEPEQQA